MAKEVFLYLPSSVLNNEFVLNNGVIFPKISLGLSQIQGFEGIYSAVDTALEVGYRSFDCSPEFWAEDNLGMALEELLPKYKLKRSDIIISSKIFPRDYGMGTTSEAFWRSCAKLRTDYIDLFLMQWPGGYNKNSEDLGSQQLRIETWLEIVELCTKGLIKTPGVCHFTCKHLESLRSNSTKIPSIAQVEFHPRCPQIELMEYCKNNDIVVQACSFKDSVHPLLRNDNTVKEVANTVGKSTTEIVLKWILNKNVGVIPESESEKQIRRNFHLFDFILEKEEMDKINSIKIREKYLRNPIIVN